MDISIKIVLLFVMVFMHIVDDFTTQGILAKLKSKEYWVDNVPKNEYEMYKNDYKVALIAHSFKWSFSIMMIPMICLIVENGYKIAYGALFVLLMTFFTNMIVHSLIDDLKANIHQINLVQDQIIHMVQICMTWVIFIYFL